MYGTKLSPDGTLLFQPATNGIGVYDGRLGILRNRIVLSFALSANYDALFEDGKDNVLLAIVGATGNSIAVVDLTSIGEPPPVPYGAAFYSMQELTALQHSTPAEDLGTIRRTTKTANQSTARLRVIPHVTNPYLLQPK